MLPAVAQTAPQTLIVILGHAPRTQGNRSGLRPWIPARARDGSLGRDDSLREFG